MAFRALWPPCSHRFVRRQIRSFWRSPIRGPWLMLVPIVLFKLWSVLPKLFEWPPLRSAAHAAERLSLLLLPLYTLADRSATAVFGTSRRNCPRCSGSTQFVEGGRITVPGRPGDCVRGHVSQLHGFVPPSGFIVRAPGASRTRRRNERVRMSLLHGEGGHVLVIASGRGRDWCRGGEANPPVLSCSYPRGTCRPARGAVFCPGSTAGSGTARTGG
jgi:hypothetical protein